MLGFLAASLLCAAVLVQAQHHNATDNSTADYNSQERIGWKSSPDGRSTMDIIWSCASVLLVCTYKCLHLNISSFEQQRAGWHCTKRVGIPYRPEWALLKKWLRKAKWMVVILLAPELGVAVAVEQLGHAREVVREAERSFPGLAVSLSHGFYSVAGGFAVLERSKDSSVPQNLKPLDLVSYLEMCRNTQPFDTPIVTEHEIDSLSKSDSFTKLFAITQASWLVVQSIARVSVGLPITELELMTMAYVVCAVMMYTLWWSKPFDVEHVTTIMSAVERDDPNWMPKPWSKQPEMYEDPIMAVTVEAQNSKLRPVLYITAMVFSVIHLVAWNWQFPHPVARILWRTFALTATVAALIMFCLFPLLQARFTVPSDPSEDDEKFCLRMILSVTSFVPLLILYIISRMGLLVLVFYSLCSMPAGVYETVDWTTYFPYFS